MTIVTAMLPNIVSAVVSFTVAGGISRVSRLDEEEIEAEAQHEAETQESKAQPTEELNAEETST